ncbi:MAG: CocE/NonD family hydrolase [Candidatus Aminicenantes bacterium]|nr:MAG: CocE/NonD family hydrolase [Candidatus Aminicenantes bacterium]
MKNKIRNLTVVCATLIICVSFSQAESIISKPEYRVRMELGVMIPMRDGVKLSSDFYFPDAEGKFPTILIRTPYNNSSSRYDRYGKFYAGRGYVVVTQDCRGRYDSEGEWYPFVGDEYDGYDTIEWIAKQPWSSGKVGMTGVSYVGFVQWMAATERPPHLTCIFTYGSPSSIYGDTWFSFGTLYLMDAITWAFLMDGRTNQNMGVHDWMNLKDHLPLMTLDEFLGRKIGYWKDWLSHPNYDEYWAKQGLIGRYQKINIPSVTVTGWYDDGQHGSLENYYGLMREGTDFAKKNAKLIIGYWRHGGPYPHTNNYYTELGAFDFGSDALLDLETYELRWFDHWLKGYQNNIMNEPKVKLFILGQDEWRDEAEWPLPDTQYTKFYLHSNGKANTLFGDGYLNTTPPKKEAPDEYVYDPADPVPSVRGGTGARGGISSDPIDQRINEKRMDVLCYTSEILKEDLEITGPIEIILYASSSAKDTDFCGKLVNVYPSGAAYNVCYSASGLISARFRESLESPSLIEPDKVYKYEIKLRPTGFVFKKGHRIRVEIASSDFPVFNRNLNTGKNPYTSTEMIKAKQTIYHNSEYPSHIILPVIGRKK